MFRKRLVIVALTLAASASAAGVLAAASSGGSNAQRTSAPAAFLAKPCPAKRLEHPVADFGAPDHHGRAM